MAKCFIHGDGLKSYSELNSKHACLKVYREKDEKELSIYFDNSLGAMKEECRRIEACIFPNESSRKPEKTIYISNSNELASVITQFVLGL